MKGFPSHLGEDLHPASGNRMKEREIPQRKRSWKDRPFSDSPEVSMWFLFITLLTTFSKVLAEVKSKQEVEFVSDFFNNKFADHVQKIPQNQLTIFFRRPRKVYASNPCNGEFGIIYQHSGGKAALQIKRGKNYAVSK